jgi:hypothetical protein
MITDALLNFLPLGSNQTLVGGAGVSFQVGNIIDLLGLGVGVPPTNQIIGNVTNFGAPDAMGVGGPRPELVVTIGTAATTGTAATLDLALQCAPDSGSPTYQPGTWTDVITSGPITAANLTAGQLILRSPWLPPFPPGTRPRYLRLYAIIPSATDFTAGTINSALVTTVRDDYFAKYAANNYVVS